MKKPRSTLLKDHSDLFAEELFDMVVESKLKNYLKKLLNFVLPAQLFNKLLLFRQQQCQHNGALFPLLDKFNLSHLYKSSGKFKIINNTVYLPINIHLLENLDDPKKLISQKTLKILKTNHAHLLFDLSGEDVLFEASASQRLLNFHNILQNAGIDAKRVTLICGNTQARKSYAQWAKHHNLKYIVNMIGYSYYLFLFAWETKISFLNNNDKQTLLQVAYKTISHNERRNKHFMCLNLKIRPHRTLILLYLLAKGHLDKGIVTYIGAETIQPTNEIHLPYPAISAFIKQLPDSEQLFSCYDKLEKLRPILFERNPHTYKTSAYHAIGRGIQTLVPEIKYYGSIQQIDTYFEIVTETFFTDENNLYITEKTIRPMLRLQPFIMIGSPHTLQYLRSIGFKTFSPYINETYDAIDNEVQRMQMIFQEVERLCSMSLEELHSMYVELWPILEYNYHHFITNMPTILEQETQQNLFAFL